MFVVSLGGGRGVGAGKGTNCPTLFKMGEVGGKMYFFVVMCFFVRLYVCTFPSLREKGTINFPFLKLKRRRLRTILLFTGDVSKS